MSAGNETIGMAQEVFVIVRIGFKDGTPSAE